MGTLARRTSSIHKIREFPLSKVNLTEEYDVLATVGQGWFAQVLLTEHRLTRSEVILKAVSKDATSRREFFREFHYSYYLSPHPNIVKTYDVAFESDRFFLFAQEVAPLGDLTSNIGSESGCGGLGEIYTKRIMWQLASAIDFMHSKELVHRDLKMDNVLVFTTDFSLIKLADFGSTRLVGTLVKRRNELLPYCAPEIVQAVYNEGYHVNTAQDVWQFGVLLFVCLTGALPWQKADVNADPKFASFCDWQQRKNVKAPPKFKNLTLRLQRLLKRLLEPNENKRVSMEEYFKYAQDKWIAKAWERDDDGTKVPPLTKSKFSDLQSVNFSMVSVHSCLEEKNKLLRTLTEFGIETTVDRTAKKQRIRDWIQSSVVCESK